MLQLQTPLQTSRQTPQIRCFRARRLARAESAKLDKLLQSQNERPQPAAEGDCTVGVSDAQGRLCAAALLCAVPGPSTLGALVAAQFPGSGSVIAPLLLTPGFDQERRLIRFCLSCQRSCCPGAQWAAVRAGSPSAEEHTALYLGEGLALRAVLAGADGPLLLFRRQYLPACHAPTQKVALAELARLRARLAEGWAAADYVWDSHGLRLCLQPLNGAIV